MPQMAAEIQPSRGQVLQASCASAAAVLLPLLSVQPAQATPQTLAALIRAVAGGAELHTGKVKLDVPPLVENGNTVPITISVQSPMSEADHVKSIHVFNEKNPQPNVGNFHLGPRAGRAQVATRIRLADSQKVVA